MVQSRRDEFQVCMEILEVLSLSSSPVAITELIRKVGIKHMTGKKVLENMIRIKWVSESFSDVDDDRLGNVFALTEKGRKILTFYQHQIREIFYQLGKR